MLAPLSAYGGPPFDTDDPGIVEAGHVELLPFHSSTYGASGAGLGNGGTQVPLAASVQKTLDPFTAYMTAGYAVNDAVVRAIANQEMAER